MTLPSEKELHIQSENAFEATCIHCFSFFHSALLYKVCVHHLHSHPANSSSLAFVSPGWAILAPSASPHTLYVPVASYFSGPLMETLQFARTFLVLIEPHFFCLSKARMRQDLKSWGLSKPEGKEDQGSVTESWSQINWITVWALCY